MVRQPTGGGVLLGGEVYPLSVGRGRGVSG